MSAAPLAPALAQAIADELVTLTEMLAVLADDLGSDIEIVRRHIGALQAVDQISQVQLALADVLRAHGRDRDRVATVPLEALAERLRAAVHG